MAQIPHDLHEKLLLFSFKEYDATEKLIHLIYHYAAPASFDYRKEQHDEKVLRSCLKGIIQHTNDGKDLLHTC